MNFTKINLEQLENLSSALSNARNDITSGLANIKNNLSTIKEAGYMKGMAENALESQLEIITKLVNDYSDYAERLINKITEIREKSETIDKEEGEKEQSIFDNDPIANNTPTSKPSSSNGNTLPDDWKSPQPVLYYGVSQPKNVVSEQKEVYSYLKGMGLNDAAVAGIMGNIQRESGFNEKNSAMDSNGYKADGLFCWNEEFTPAWKYGTTVNSQMRYMESTISPSTLNKLKNVPNTEAGAQQAAIIFASEYERCSKTSYSDRQLYASNYYKSF